jgi:hypothetical protein
MNQIDEKAVLLRAYGELSARVEAQDRLLLDRLAATNLDVALAITGEVARVTLLARAIAPGQDEYFDLEARDLIRIGSLRPAETRILLQAGIHADREDPHPAGVRAASDLLSQRFERVMRCLN